MSEAWVGVIGTLVGAIVGGIIAAFVSLRGQQREPRLLVLEKRIEAHGKLFRGLYEISSCLQRDDRQNMSKIIDEFRNIVLNEIFYLDTSTKEHVLKVYNYLMKTLESGELEPTKLMKFINEASHQLFKGVGMDYT